MNFTPLYHVYLASILLPQETTSRCCCSGDRRILGPKYRYTAASLVYVHSADNFVRVRRAYTVHGAFLSALLVYYDALVEEKIHLVPDKGNIHRCRQFRSIGYAGSTHGRRVNTCSVCVRVRTPTSFVANCNPNMPPILSSSNTGLLGLIIYKRPARW